MSYLIGYIADRSGVISSNRQTKRLYDHGVDEKDIYKNLDDALNSLREGDEFVVFTTAILGRNKLHNTFVTVGLKNCTGVFSVDLNRLYQCDMPQTKVIADAWSELEGATKKHIAKVGAQLGGRKQGDAWSHHEMIHKYYHGCYEEKILKHSYLEIVEELGDIDVVVSDSTVRRIVATPLPEKNRGKTSK